MKEQKLSDLPEHKRTKEWILSEIRYEKHEGIHTFSICGVCKINGSRSGRCYACWEKLLQQVKQ